MTPKDLLDHAERLVTTSPGKPYQADLRRSVSAAYYALFHAVAQTAADTLIGTTAAHRTSETWRRVYRSLEHGYAKSQCLARTGTQVPAGLADVADAFVQLQELRHAADYDPASNFLRDDVLAHVVLARTAVSRLNAAPLTDRRVFAAWLVFRSKA